MRFRFTKIAFVVTLAACVCHTEARAQEDSEEKTSVITERPATRGYVPQFRRFVLRRAPKLGDNDFVIANQSGENVVFWLSRDAYKWKQFSLGVGRRAVYRNADFVSFKPPNNRGGDPISVFKRQTHVVDKEEGELILEIETEQ